MFKIIAALVLSTSLLSAPSQAAEFAPLDKFGANPGQLSASYYLPSKTPAAVVVLLHGCAQDAQQLARDSGFMTLAKRANVALLLPQQSDSNNIKRCFNWFSNQDTDKDQGETLSIINMVDTLASGHQIKDIYIAGLSAGGAMASSLIANYPTKFTAGAIIAGLPYPCADNLIKAISCMRQGPSDDAKQLAQSIAKDGVKPNQWPPISIWTGVNDKIVAPANATMLAKQWQLITGAEQQTKSNADDGFHITQWQRDDRIAVELIEINNMGHGIPIKPKANDGSRAAPFVLEASLSTAIHVFNFWNLTTKNNT